MKSQGPLAALAEYESDSTPGKMYQVMMGEDGVVYCTCPAWRFQKGRSPSERVCKHIRRFKGECHGR
jgi:hypothetical protein